MFLWEDPELCSGLVECELGARCLRATGRHEIGTGSANWPSKKGGHREAASQGWRAVRSRARPSGVFGASLQFGKIQTEFLR